MTANYPDIICKYLTWYNQVRVEVEHETRWQMPVLRVYDDRMGTRFTIFNTSQITQVFRDIGIWRMSYGRL